MNIDHLIKDMKVQPDLERRIWDDDDQLNSQVRKALLRVVHQFYDGLELENKPPIQDIVFTGSLANYNYSKFSDIDVHLLFDFAAYGENREVFEQFFLLAKGSWNKKYDVRVRGYQVEIYAEDIANPHHSTGLYSIQNDEWVKRPERAAPLVDKLDVKTKVHYFKCVYDHLTKDMDQKTAQELLGQIEQLRDKIAKFRKAGLEQGGEFSTENIAFKVMRRSGFLDELAKLRDYLVSKKLSIETAV